MFVALRVLGQSPYLQCDLFVRVDSRMTVPRTAGDGPGHRAAGTYWSLSGRSFREADRTAAHVDREFYVARLVR